MRLMHSCYANLLLHPRGNLCDKTASEFSGDGISGDGEAMPKIGHSPENGK